MRSRLAISFGLLLLLAVALGAWNFQNQLVSITYLSAPSATPAHTPTASDSSRADAFLNTTLTPALVSFNQTLSALRASCTPDLPNACRDAISNSHQKLQHILTSIDHGDIPTCIATPMRKYRSDLLALDGALVLSLNGYQSQSHQLVANGLSRFSAKGASLGSGAQVVSLAALTCAR